jgi:Leucine-rich repeat (LRR) protein
VLAFGGRSNDSGTASPTASPTTAAPSTVPSVAPSAAPSMFAIERFQQEILPEFSQVAIQDSTSPQSKALKWLANNAELESYENFKRLQRFALATFYYATGGENWMDNDGWLSDNAECTWGTLACLTGRYWAIIVDNNNLVGTLPNELTMLTNLEFLYLFSNALSGQIPSTLGLLTKLQELILLNNIITGIIPSQLGACTKLTELRLEANLLTGPVPTTFGLFSQLADLRLYNNSLSSTVPTQLGACTKLEILHLDNNKLTGPIPSTLGLLTRLQELALNNNTLTGSVPAEVCQLVRTNNLTVQIDCELVACDCGCACAVDTVFDRSFEDKRLPSVF